MADLPDIKRETLSQSQPLISVVVVNYLSGPLLDRCLEALTLQTWQNIEILVVDNGSEDGSITAVNGRDSRIRLLSPGVNLGFAAANNLAAAEARGGLACHLESRCIS